MSMVAVIVLTFFLSAPTVGAAAMLSGLLVGPAVELGVMWTSSRARGPMWWRTMAWTVWGEVDARLAERRKTAVDDAAHHIRNEY
jgi:hypothetical protein